MCVQFVPICMFSCSVATMDSCMRTFKEATSMLAPYKGVCTFMHHDECYCCEVKSCAELTTVLNANKMQYILIASTMCTCQLALC